MRGWVKAVADALLYGSIGFCIAMTFADANISSETRVEWETLLAGLVAIAAAFITVLQMRKTDADATFRFKQQLNMANAEKKRAIERAIKRILDLKPVAMDSLLAMEAMQIADSQPDQLKEVGRARAIQERFARALRSTALVMAEQHLSPDTQLILETARDTAGYMSTTIDVQLDRATAGDLQAAQNMQSHVNRYARFLHDECEQLATALGEDLKLYD